MKALSALILLRPVAPLFQRPGALASPTLGCPGATVQATNVSGTLTKFSGPPLFIFDIRYIYFDTE
jgi:hypothetical protein